VSAEEIVMICKNEDSSIRYHKYVNPIVGKRNVYQRVSGEWIVWGTSQKSSSIQVLENNLKVTKRGAIIKQVLKVKLSKDKPKYKLVKGQHYLMHSTYILDFEFVTREEEQYYTRMNRTPIFGTDSENPNIKNWTCDLREK